MSILPTCALYSVLLTANSTPNPDSLTRPRLSAGVRCLKAYVTRFSFANLESATWKGLKAEAPKNPWRITTTTPSALSGDEGCTWSKSKREEVEDAVEGTPLPSTDATRSSIVAASQALPRPCTKANVSQEPPTEVEELSRWWNWDNCACMATFGENVLC